MSADHAEETQPSRSVSELLAELALEAQEQPLHYSDLIDRFGRRGFGVLLLLVTLPTFLPLPVGAVTGPLCALIGLQMLLMQSHPWLPARLRRRPMDGKRLTLFLEKRGHWLRRLERLAHPRWPAFTRSRPVQAFSGLLIAANGILLSLPIPFTNYVFGMLLLLFCLALLERDGRLMLLAWLFGSATVIAFALLSQELVNRLSTLL
ncbi:MAG: exopolysaccharide biosynthesis protein [Lysobacteraceae bacterium]